MSKKSYKHSDNASQIAGEPAVAYHRIESPAVVDWNPNAPVHATQEEWWEHIHEIEEGHFMTLEEFNCRFDAWEKNYLASRLK
ncbi:hypothetical protein AGMMS50239_31020 [Bacteroidia bacterium]|nr:hypothetical protein AGMMS50239_31020 [Bacteroidia bacterium]